MKISKKAEYALRALVAMGREREGTNFSIQDLASKEHIPLKFLEQILLALKNGGLLRSKRGVGGGYQLVTHPARITLGEVVTLFDGPFDPVPGAEHDALGQVFGGLRDQVTQWFAENTIAHIISKEQPRGAVSFDI
ncbi:RrF2 family transcriptional regulator [Prosthecobacter vanneervenii]|uniref:Rrf2 family protein n=1 Tax=Prosthecobacter vanneervenii TaxID=48466 RepID=A0A7W7YCS5_9BACT|nr:Rrf2 family transcriptional regulator [Prosthecobacter vanneervenii]MBB5033657.1 Rrf2 family protein [Prosthecobacter vanneervenii]